MCVAFFSMLMSCQLGTEYYTQIKPDSQQYSLSKVSLISSPIKNARITVQNSNSFNLFIQVEGDKEVIAQVDQIQYTFVDLSAHSQIKVTGTAHFIDDWQGEAGFLAVIDNGDKPLEVRYIVELSMLDLKGNKLGAPTKVEVVVENEDKEEYNIGAIQLVALTYDKGFSSTFINIEVDISISSSEKSYQGAVNITATPVDDTSPQFNIEPTCDMTLSTGMCIGNGSIIGNPIGHKYSVKIEIVNEDGKTVYSESQNVVVQPLLEITDISVNYLGNGMYQYNVTIDYTTNSRLDSSQTIMMSIDDENQQKTDYTLLDLNGTDRVSAFFVSGMRQARRNGHIPASLKFKSKKKKYRHKSGVLSINIYESGNSMIIPPTSTEVTINDLSAELTPEKLKTYITEIQENRNTIRRANGKGICRYGKCF